MSASVGGKVSPAFQGVLAEFRSFLSLPGEIGASLSVVWRGETVVDVWGGRVAQDSPAPWQQNTIANVFSASKGIGNMCVVKCAERGLLRYDDKVSKHWPEFAAGGKESITIAQLLSHQGGVAVTDEPLTLEQLRDAQAPHSTTSAALSRQLALQSPNWSVAPGKEFGYHALTVGLYLSQLIQKVDPHHRSLRAFFNDEFGCTSPARCEFSFGVAAGSADEKRCAKLCFLPPDQVSGLTPEFEQAGVDRDSLTARSFGAIKGFSAWRARDLEIPSAIGLSTGRAMAELYCAMSGDGCVTREAEGGGGGGGRRRVRVFDASASAAALRREAGLREAVRGIDKVLLTDVRMSVCGYNCGLPDSETAFGHTGMGGSLGQGDFGFGGEGLGIGFVTNALHTNGNYERRDRLVTCVYECLREATKKTSSRL